MKKIKTVLVANRHKPVASSASFFHSMLGLAGISTPYRADSRSPFPAIRIPSAVAGEGNTSTTFFCYQKNWFFFTSDIKNSEPLIFIFMIFQEIPISYFCLFIF